MLIQLEKLKRRPRQIDVALQANAFPVISELVSDGSIAFNDEISGSLEVMWAGDVIKVSGRLATTVTSACCRCLLPVITPLDISVQLSYVAGGDDVEPVDEELELQCDELGLITFSGPELDLQPDIEQEIIMALPQQPLCKESCLGLCPVCGCDLNQETCSCDPPVLHAGLAALKNFKVKK